MFFSIIKFLIKKINLMYFMLMNLKNDVNNLPVLSKIYMKKFSYNIIMWYEKFGRKNLPWQINKNPYKIWLSEIMLQQTQVSVVIPYFNNFIKNFPTIFDLANSNEDKILFLWTGLGFYSRAINLYKTAKIIVNDYNGQFPKKLFQLIMLPGIGKSTAGAILSLSFNKFFPILDTNVKRVLSRFFGISGYLENKTVNDYLWDISNRVTSKKHVAKYNQGIMDIGSMICKNKNPICKLCPLKKNCFAFFNKACHKFPEKKSKKYLIKKVNWFLIIEYKNNVLLQKQLKNSFWKGLYCFPKFNSLSSLNKSIKNITDKKYKLYQLKIINQNLSNFNLTIIPIILKFSIEKKLQIEGIWYDYIKPAKIGISSPVKYIISHLKTLKLNIKLIS